MKAWLIAFLIMVAIWTLGLKPLATTLFLWLVVAFKAARPR